MDLLLEQLGADSLDEVIQFLRDCFATPPDALFLQRDHVRWKFFDPRPDWEGSRSFVYRVDGRIVAHAGIVPATLVGPRGTLTRSIFAIDWAASPSVAGAGILLMQEIAALADVRIGYGGSPVTRALQRRGIAATNKRRTERVMGDVARARRALRPSVLIWNRSSPMWRSIVRAGREMWRNLSHPLAPHHSWTARPVERFHSPLPDMARLADTTGCFLPRRTPELLNYMLLCPTARFAGFLLESGGAVRGHLLLSSDQQEVRIADLLIDSAAPADWMAAYSLAVLAARSRFPAAAYLRAIATAPSLQSALAGAGFQEQDRMPLVVQDRAGAFTDDPALVVNMIDSDAAYYFERAEPRRGHV
jgi:hypothetical protein